MNNGMELEGSRFLYTSPERKKGINELVDACERGARRHDMCAKDAGTFSGRQEYEKRAENLRKAAKRIRNIK